MRAMTPHQTLQDLLDDFALIDDWEERYRYVIELGRALPGLPGLPVLPAAGPIADRECSRHYGAPIRSHPAARLSPATLVRGRPDLDETRALLAADLRHAPCRFDPGLAQQRFAEARR